MISVDEARNRILDYVAVLPAEEAELMDGLGRVLAEDVRAEESMPPFDNSAMDGYAVRAADVGGASEQAPVSLKVLEDVAAGYTATREVGPDQAIRIMTGAPMPAGADSVVMVERTRRADGGVEVLAPVGDGQNVRRTGEDVAAGDLVLRQGKVLRAGDIGLLASIGRPSVQVVRRPRVAVLSTGDELVEVDEALAPGKIRNSNAYALASQVLEAGGVPELLGIARDTAEHLAEKIKEGLGADVLITSGGVSVGDYDFVKDVLGELGQMLFWKVSMKPAKPLAFGMIGGKPTFGLPGNPTSSMVSFEQFVRPTLLKLAGRSDVLRPEVEVVVSQPIKKKPGRQFFLRVMLNRRDGRIEASLTGPQGSGILRSMSLAQGLLVLPEDAGDLAPGDKAVAQLLYPDDLAG